LANRNSMPLPLPSHRSLVSVFLYSMLRPFLFFDQSGYPVKLVPKPWKDPLPTFFFSPCFRLRYPLTPSYNTLRIFFFNISGPFYTERFKPSFRESSSKKFPLDFSFSSPPFFFLSSRFYSSPLFPGAPLYPPPRNESQELICSPLSPTQPHDYDADQSEICPLSPLFFLSSTS